MPDDLAAHASRLMAEAVVWDSHGCLPTDPVLAVPFLGDLERYRRAGVSAVFINLGDGNVPLQTEVQMAALLRQHIRQNPDALTLLRTVHDIRAAKRSGRLAVGFDIEGVWALGDQLPLIELMYDLGVRWMALVYNRRNLVGSGVHDPEDGGLTGYGRQFIAEMDRVGMIKCCTHTSPKTTEAVIEASDLPTIFSHSNPAALHAHPRNISDHIIRRCAAKGGVVCINGVGIFLGDNDTRPATLARHIDHVIQLVGDDHVGLGLDHVADVEAMDAHLAADRDIWPAEFGYRPGIKFVPPEDIVRVVEALIGLNHSDQTIAKVLGGNMLRVAERVWK